MSDSTPNCSTSGCKRRLGCAVSRILVPGWILFGALAKLIYGTPQDLPKWIQSWLVDPSLPDHAGQTLLAAIITVELIAVLAILVLGRFARLIGGALLMVFIFVLIAEVNFLANRSTSATFFSVLLTGDCGCFGAVTIPPIVMISVDALLLLGLITLRAGSPAASAARPITTPRLVTFLVLAALAAGFASQGPLIKPDDTLRQSDLPDHQLRPNLWIGERFEQTPLARITSLDPDMLGGGRQHWIFYRKTCGMCHALFEEEYSGLTPPEGVSVVIAISVPPVPGVVDPMVSDEIACDHCEFVTLDPTIDWEVITPSIVVIEDGVVVEFHDAQFRGHGPAR